MKINLNDEVTFTLSALGAARYNEHLAKFRVFEDYKAGDIIKTELWNMAHVFGEHMYNGCTNPFESTDMEIRSRK